MLYQALGLAGRLCDLNINCTSVCFGQVLLQPPPPAFKSADWPKLACQSGIALPPTHIPACRRYATSLQLSLGKSLKDIQERVAAAYGDKRLQKIIMNVKKGKPTTDQQKLNSRRKVQNPSFIADVAADIKKDRRVTVRRLALALWHVEKHHPEYASPGSEPVKKISKMGAQTAHG
jgi:hypothetical protein